MLGRTQAPPSSPLDAAEQYAAEARKYLTQSDAIRHGSNDLKCQYATAAATLAIYELLKAQAE